MSLKLLRAVEVTNLGSTIAANSGVAGLTTINGNPCGSASTDTGDAFYLASRDRVYTMGFNTNMFSNLTLFKLDPDLLLSNPSDGVFAAKGTGDALGVGAGYMSIGQFNPTTGQQPMYFSRTAGFPVVSVNVDTLVVGSGAGAFVGPNGSYTIGASDNSFPAEGHWSSSAFTLKQLFFEGVTEGIPGETLLTGPGAYPFGLALAHLSGCQVAGLTRNNIFGWVDLRTRRVVGQLGGLTPIGFPARAMSSPTSQQTQTESPIASDAFVWVPAQFVPDSDSGYTQPKGRIFFHSAEPLPTAQASIVDPVPGDAFRHYVRLIDFNPFALPSAQGIPTRTHGRIRLTSRLVIQRSPIYSQAGAAEAFGFTATGLRSFYDPLRSRFGCFIHRNFAPMRTQFGDNYCGLFSTGVDPVIVSAPAARSVPRTGGVTDYECFVGGDLGEPGPGVTVAFTLARRSTEGELLTISGGIGTTSTVAHPAIDTDSAGVVDLALAADGAPLVLTTDYTVVASTGVITWVTSQVGKTVLATYKHRATDALPAHGTLLVGQGQADENGIVRTQVAVPDEDTLVGTIDALTSTLA